MNGVREVSPGLQSSHATHPRGQASHPWRQQTLEAGVGAEFRIHIGRDADYLAAYARDRADRSFLQLNKQFIHS